MRKGKASVTAQADLSVSFYAHGVDTCSCSSNQNRTEKSFLFLKVPGHKQVALYFIYIVYERRRGPLVRGIRLWYRRS